VTTLGHQDLDGAVVTPAGERHERGWAALIFGLIVAALIKLKVARVSVALTEQGDNAI
jgi:hypothetical protein